MMGKVLSHQPTQTMPSSATISDLTAPSAQVALLRHGELRALDQRVGGYSCGCRTTLPKGRSSARLR
jgi:hypothetical protein